MLLIKIEAKKVMWKRCLDIFPGEWVGTEHESELKKELETGDRAKVIVDSQFQDRYPIPGEALPKLDIGEELPRCYGRIGTVIEIDEGDEWSYKLLFQDGETNWFKRYILEKCD